MLYRLLSLALIAGTVVTAGTGIAQELSIEGLDNDGQVIDLGKSPTASSELPKASGFPELMTPDEPPLPYIKEDNETIVLPPPANVNDPKPVKPALKEPEKPVVKKPVKPVVKAPVKPVVKKPAKPVVKAPAKPVVKTEPTLPPRITAKPKLVIPLPRTKPKTFVKRPTPAKKAALPKATVPKATVPKAPVQKVLVPKKLVPKNIVPKTPEPELPVQKALVPKTLVPKNIVPKTPALATPAPVTPEPEIPVHKTLVPKTFEPKNLVPKTPALVTPAPVLPEPETKAPQEVEIEIHQLDSIPSTPVSAAPPVESGPILDIPIVGVEVAPAPEEAATPQKRKSNRIDRN